MIRATLLLVAAFGLAAAAVPLKLADARPGHWELTGVPDAKGPVKLCVADVLDLVTIDHRPGGKCSYRHLGDSGSSARIGFSCSGGGFGQASVGILTPRSLRIATQGIVGGAPYNYVAQARRIGDCIPAGPEKGR